jgi:hypothetical protein
MLTVLGRECDDALMKLPKLNDWLQVVANLGIVIGLLLVGVQLKQNSDLLKTQLLYDESHRAIELETQVIGEDGARVWAKSLTDPENLTLEEQRIIEALLWSFAEQLRATRMLAELGLLDDSEWRVRVYGESGFWLGNRYGRAWWANYSDDSEMPDDLIAAVNDRLSEVTAEHTLTYMAGARNGLGERPDDDEAPAE